MQADCRLQGESNSAWNQNYGWQSYTLIPCCFLTNKQIDPLHHGQQDVKGGT